MEDKLISTYKARLKSILLNSTLPSFILLLLILVALQALMLQRYEFDANKFLIEVVALGLGLIILLVLITYRIKKFTYVNVFETYVEISDVSKMNVRFTKLRFNEIKSIEFKKNTVIIEAREQIKIIHLENPYGLEQQVSAIIKQLKEESSQ